MNVFRMKSSLFCSSLISLTLVAGCGSTETPPPAAAAGKPVDAATVGSIAGQVMFQGPPPAVETVKMDTDSRCGAPTAPSDAVLINSAGQLQNVFVYVKDGLDPAYAFDPPSAPVVVDQRGCRYAPRVFGLRTGQTVEVVNDDSTLHNVHSLARSNLEFNQTTPLQGTRAKFAFTVPETMVRFKCDVHPWMNAYAGVLAHPFFAVSGPDGRFELKGLPPGTYTIEAWHERFGAQTQTIAVAGRQAQTISFTFTAKG
jgi:plastocyanin